MHISAKTDYAVRAMLIIAEGRGGRVKAEDLALAQGLPRKFLESILGELRRAGLVASWRGPDGGFVLGRDAADISVADVMRAVDGPLAEVRGLRPEQTVYTGTAEPLGAVWVAVRASLRAVLEAVTIAHILDGPLPDAVTGLTSDPDAWLSR